MYFQPFFTHSAGMEWRSGINGGRSSTAGTSTLPRFFHSQHQIESPPPTYRHQHHHHHRPESALGVRSKSQDAMLRRKTVRFVSDNLRHQQEQPQILDERPCSRGKGSNRSFFLLSMLQGGNESSSSGRSAKSSKVM